jgi:flavin reductase (DIM6/NTAB) family NADH-FMN oxidoreductase RutF
VNADEFRSVLRRFPTGVTIVTTLVDGKPKGFTANAFSSVSLDPPIVLVCVNRQARSHPLIARAGKFCVNLLRLEQADLALRFATPSLGDPFSPVLDGTLGYLDCELSEEHSAGTHTIFLGGVVACGSEDGAPLGYFNADYRDFGCRIP